MPASERRERAPRSDAARNRGKVLEAAAAICATQGLSLSVREVAQRAGVGLGTVGRHFPAKEDLLAAVLLEVMADLAEKARVLQDSRAPGEAFFDLFAAIVQAGADNRGLSEAFAGSDCVDLEVLGRESGYDVSASLGQLLLAAQQSGEIRDDVDYPAVRALLAGCSAGVYGGADTTVLLGVIRQGLVPVPPA